MRLAPAAAAALLLLAAAGGAWWLLWPRDEVTPVRASTASNALVYATEGFEEVDALGGARHEYPDTTTISVIRRPSGCVVYRWRPLEERVFEWELCGGELLRYTEQHEFFSNPDRRTYRCEPGSSLRDGWRCTSPKTTETGRVVDSRPGYVRLKTRVSGETKGTGTRELWLREDDVLERMIVENRNETPTLVGPVAYRERFELRLVEGSSRG